jgi:hypothetical protein
MDTLNPSSQEVVVTEVIHFCDYLWEGQLHLYCKRAWANKKFTEKSLEAQGIIRSTGGLYTEDESKATCPVCKQKRAQRD